MADHQEHDWRIYEESEVCELREQSQMNLSYAEGRAYSQNASMGNPSTCSGTVNRQALRFPQRSLNHSNYRPSMIDIAPYLNTIMWAHYTDYYKGYCAMYNFPSDITSVKDSDGYVLHTGEIDYVEELQYPSEIYFQLGFMTKNNRWEYEHEKRMLYFQRDGVATGHPEVKLPKGCLKKVYIGLRCEDETAIKDALEDKFDEVYKIKISEQDIYSFEAVEIDRTTWEPKGKETVKPQCVVEEEHPENMGIKDLRRYGITECPKGGIMEHATTI